MIKVAKHRLLGAWKVLTGQAYVVSKTPPSYPFVLRIGHKVEVHYKSTPATTRAYTYNITLSKP